MNSKALPRSWRLVEFVLEISRFTVDKDKRVHARLLPFPPSPSGRCLDTFGQCLLFRTTSSSSFSGSVVVVTVVTPCPLLE